MELMGIVHDLLDRYHTVLGQTLVGILTETGAQMWLSQDYLWTFHVQFVARVGVPLKKVSSTKTYCVQYCVCDNPHGENWSIYHPSDEHRHCQFERFFSTKCWQFSGSNCLIWEGPTILGLDMTTLFQFAGGMENHHVQRARYAPVIKHGVLENLSFIYIYILIIKPLFVGGFSIASHVWLPEGNSIVNH